MRRVVISSLFLLLLALLPLGCGEDHRNDLSWVLSRYGKPEDTEVSYSPDGISYMILWYWSQGRGFKFKEESYTEMRGVGVQGKVLLEADRRIRIHSHYFEGGEREA